MEMPYGAIVQQALGGTGQGVNHLHGCRSTQCLQRVAQHTSALGVGIDQQSGEHHCAKYRSLRLTFATPHRSDVSRAPQALYQRGTTRSPERRWRW